MKLATIKRYNKHINFEDVMKNLTNSDELDQTIEKLDNLLIKGHLKYTTQRQGYFQNKDKEGFSVDAFCVNPTG